MIKKNDEFTVKIEDIGIDGEGIGKVDGYPLFIKDAIKGDLVRVKVMKAAKNYGYGRLLEVIEPSEDRIEPVCPVSKSCGGCQIQEMKYESQLEFKKNKVKNNIERIGKLKGFDIFDTIGMDYPYEYRNKSQFPVGKDKDGEIITGFYAGRTHSIIPCLDCKIGIKENKEILKIVLEHMKENNISPYNELDNSGDIRHILIRKGFKTGEIMVSIVVNGKKLNNSDKLVEKLVKINGMTDISINVNREKTNVILGKKIIQLYGNGYISDYLDGVKFQISPLSFYQVNPIQTEVLYNKALEYAGLTGNEIVMDLYCGVGTISLFLAKAAKKVIGVEIIKEAIDDAKENARINEIKNAEFYVGKAEEVIPRLYEENGIKADVVVVDPPRKGCDKKLLDTIIQMNPEKVVYVSCDSATLARDLNILCENNFVLDKVQPVDLFPHSVHVETIVALHRINS